MTAPIVTVPGARIPEQRGRTSTTNGRRPVTRPRFGEKTAALFAAFLSMAAFCLGMAAHGTYPFGPSPRALNDLRHQYVPFHAHLWDIQHGTAKGDLLFNWQSGYGNGFLGEFFTYLSNPLSWLTGLFPRQYVDFPVFLVTLLGIGLAAAAMTVFLGRLRPGSPWLRALLGTGYAVSGWTMTEGGIIPMWMTGLIALPLLCIAVDDCLNERHWVLGTLLFALCWFSNFYSAAMATIGATLVLLLRLLLSDTTWRARARAVGRAAGTAATGLLLAAPAIVVPAVANKQAQPTTSYVVDVATEPLVYLGLLLPGSIPLYPAPNIFAGVLVLLLVLALPFQSRVGVRERAAWLALLVLTALSFVVTPTAKVWQGFTLPHGAPFRESFVLTGLLAMAAWICLAHSPRPRALLGGGALLAGLVLLTRSAEPVTAYAVKGTVIGGALVGGLLLLHARGLGRRGRALVVPALVLSVLATTAYAVYGAQTTYDPARYARDTTTTTNLLTRNVHRAAAENDDWPDSRVGVASSLYVTNNDPMLLGVQSGGYYSSYVTKEAAAGLRELGIGYAMGGRNLGIPRDPYFNALMGVGTLLERTKGAQITARSVPGVPLVSLRAPGSDRAYGAPAGSVWANRHAALGARVYTVPEIHYAKGPEAVREPGGWRLPRHGKGQAWTGFTARCAPGDEAYLYAPALSAVSMATGSKAMGNSGRPPAVVSPVNPLGTVPADGTLRFAIGATQPDQVLPHGAVGCMDPKKFQDAVQALRASAPVNPSVGGHSVGAELPKGSTGTVVVATPAIQGWSCSVDGGASRAPVSHRGLLGVPLGAGADRFSCSYTPPGLKAGLGGTGAGALVLAGVLVAGAVRRRRA
ncbi:YfhO family protein [Streptomyces sp. NPDC086147]|uniref:YfhO family protein n=1 Tax=Streptomyces sp. NPDC086147 TaxID=3155295 RepID=UPI00344B02F2